MLKYVTILACVIASPLLVGSHPAPGQWGITGEYLYMKPSVDDTYFVVDSPTPTVNTILEGKEKNNNFDFESGYRIGLKHEFCECDRGLALFYTNLDAKQSKTINGNNLSPSVGIETFTIGMTAYTGKASSKVNAKYQRVDALFSQGICDCSCFDLRLLAGLEYADLKVHQHLNYQPTEVVEGSFSSRVKEKSSTQAVGPEIGFDLDVELCQFAQCMSGGLNLKVFSTGSLLVGRTKSAMDIVYITSTDDNLFYDVSQEASTRIIPAFHMGIGLDYNFCVCDREISIGVGYEFNTYIKSLLNTKNSSTTGNGLTNSEYSDYALQGLTVSLSVNF